MGPFHGAVWNGYDKCVVTVGSKNTRVYVVVGEWDGYGEGEDWLADIPSAALPPQCLLHDCSQAFTCLHVVAAHTSIFLSNLSRTAIPRSGSADGGSHTHTAACTSDLSVN